MRNIDFTNKRCSFGAKPFAGLSRRSNLTWAIAASIIGSSMMACTPNRMGQTSDSVAPRSGSGDVEVSKLTPKPAPPYEKSFKDIQKYWKDHLREKRNSYWGDTYYDMRMIDILAKELDEGDDGYINQLIKLIKYSPERDNIHIIISIIPYEYLRKYEFKRDNNPRTQKSVKEGDIISMSIDVSIINDLNSYFNKNLTPYERFEKQFKLDESYLINNCIKKGFSDNYTSDCGASLCFGKSGTYTRRYENYSCSMPNNIEKKLLHLANKFEQAGLKVKFLRYENSEARVIERPSFNWDGQLLVGDVAFVPDQPKTIQQAYQNSEVKYIEYTKRDKYDKEAKATCYRVGKYHSSISAFTSQHVLSYKWTTNWTGSGGACTGSKENISVEEGLQNACSCKDSYK